MKQRLLPWLLSTLICINALPVQTIRASDLPDMGDSSGSVITPEQEQRLGEAIMRQIRRQLTLVDDPEIIEYIQSLGNQLVSNSETRTRHFEFFVVRDPSINAFALPGGYVGVNTGLLTAAETESELAAVMAHEIAHVTQRHMARAFEAADKLSLTNAAAILLAILISTKNSEAGQAAAAAVTAGSAQYQINFTRTNEYEADHIGIQTLARAGFDAQGMADFFERLQRTNRLYGDQPPEFLSTHPVTTTRISDARERAAQFPPARQHDDLSFHLVRARLRVMDARDPATAASDFAAQLKSGRYINADAEKYGYALALTDAGRYSEAQQVLQPLLRKDPDRIDYLLADARLELRLNHAQRVIDIHQDALKIYPFDRAITISYANALLELGKAPVALDLLRKHVRNRTPDTVMYRLLARAAGAAGKSGEAHAAQAEVYYMNGNTEAAVEQLELALRAPDIDFYQSSSAEARLAQFKAQALEEKKNPPRF